MKKYLIAFLLLWAFLAPSNAQFNGCQPGFCGGLAGAGKPNPPANSLLSQSSPTQQAILAAPNQPIKVQ